MARIRNTASRPAIGEFIRGMSISLIKAIGLTVALAWVCVSIGSVKFSTDRYARGLVTHILGSERMLVETIKTNTYRSYFDDIVEHLEKEHGAHGLEVTSKRPPLSRLHYSLGRASLAWNSDFTANYYIPTHWAGEEIYIKGLIHPRFVRMDLIYFMALLAGILLYFFISWNRRVLKSVRTDITEPIHRIWESFRNSGDPGQLRFQEMHDLWESLKEAKRTSELYTRMLIAREFQHQLKDPTYYLYTQLQMIERAKTEEERTELIHETRKIGKAKLESLEQGLKKIAADDFLKEPKPFNLTEMLRKGDHNFLAKEPVWISGDRSLFEAVPDNLYGNILAYRGNLDGAKTELSLADSLVTLKVSNPVAPDFKIDCDEIFRLGFTTKKHGTGIGLPLCNRLVEAHSGKMWAEHNRDEHRFSIIVELPRAEEEICSQKARLLNIKTTEQKLESTPSA